MQTDQPIETGVVRDIHTPDGIIPESPCPTTWNGSPVIVGHYVRRQPGTLPVWIVITWDKNDGDAYHLARLLPDGTSAQTHYHVGSDLPLGSQRYAKVVRLAAEEAARKNKTAAA